MLLLLATVFVLGFQAVMSPSSQANDFNGPYADNSHHTYFLSAGLYASEKTGIRNAMIYSLGSDTDMTVAEVAQGPKVDAWFFDAIKTTGDEANYYAWTVCLTPMSGNKCDHFAIAFNHVNPHSNYRSLACHEIGHSVGLGHAKGKNSTRPSNKRSCLRTDPDHVWFSDHDRSHINGRY